MRLRLVVSLGTAMTSQFVSWFLDVAVPFDDDDDDDDDDSASAGAFGVAGAGAGAVAVADAAAFGLVSVPAATDAAVANRAGWETQVLGAMPRLFAGRFPGEPEVFGGGCFCRKGQRPRVLFKFCYPQFRREAGRRNYFAINYEVKCEFLVEEVRFSRARSRKVAPPSRILDK